MAERTDLPKIKPDEQPSMLNHNAGKGAILGWLASVISGAIAYMRGATIRTTQVIAASGLVVGGVLGGLSGKKKTEQEMVNGRVVKQPGYFNKGLLSGLGVGIATALPFSIVGRPLTGWISLPVTLGAMAWGSINRKNSLQKDFDRSVAVRDAQNEAMQAQLRAQMLQQGYHNSVTPQESATMDARIAQVASHADSVLHDKAVAVEAAR